MPLPAIFAIMISMSELAAKLELSIDKGLPGTDIQWEMASSDRKLSGYPRKKRPGSKLGAVLILLYPANGVICTLFIQRPVYNGVHSGQIAFPGGKSEKSDSDLTDTALREACEETGICRELVTVIGTLTPLYIPVSDIEVTPVVGWCRSRPEIIAQPGEVVSVIEADLKHFLKPETVREKEMDVRDQLLRVKYFDYQGNVIWGATAMMLYELLVIIDREAITFH